MQISGENAVSNVYAHYLAPSQIKQMFFFDTEYSAEIKNKVMICETNMYNSHVNPVLSIFHACIQSP